VKKFFTHKYRDIILAVALFVVLDAGVLIINFYTSYQISNDAHAIQLASRQNTLSQTLLHQMYQVHEDAVSNGPYLKTIDELGETYKAFDETLDAFIYGGELIGSGQGNDALLKDATYRENNHNTLKNAELIWKEYRKHIKDVVYAYYDDLTREEVIEEVDQALAYARQNNGEFYNLLEGFTYAVEGVAQRKAERLRRIQATGITLAVINFFLILFHFLRKLGRSDAAVEQARRETTDILENVNEGLLLLDKDFVISDQHSASLAELFGDQRFAERNFLDLLRPLVTEKTLAITEDYMEILFSDQVSESLVTGLNPLEEVEINLSTKSGEYSTRYLCFDFSRVVEESGLQYLLVTVSDISEQVHLKHELKQARNKAAQDIDMLIQIMHLDSGLLMGYLDDVQASLDKVNALLRQPAKMQPHLVEKLLKISRIVHTLKGECSALNLEFIETKLHDYENVIEPLKNKQPLTGSDFIPLTVRLDHLMRDITTVRNLVLKVSSQGAVPEQNLSTEKSIGSSEIRPVTGSEKPVTGSNIQALSSIEVWTPIFEQLAQKVAKDHNKAVKLKVRSCSTAKLSSELKEAIKDITIQCLRNAIVHGLELPSQRSMMGKPMTGNLSVILEQEEGSSVVLKVRDDGMGIDIEGIRKRAEEKGIASKEELASWKPGKLIKLIFQPGFSTFDTQSDHHAGRGVGLDAVKALLDDNDGKMGVSYRPGEYTEFRFRFETVKNMLAATA